MIKINKIEDLHNLKIENYFFSVIKENEKNCIFIENKKEKVNIKIEYNKENLISVFEKIKKYTEIRVVLNELNTRETLSFVQSSGYEKKLWNPIGKAMHKFNMIEEGDRVAVGISGGKDSIVTLNALIRIKKVAKIDFEIIPIHIHLKEDISDFSEIIKYIEKMGLKLRIVETNLGDILFKENGEIKEKNPCFLCGRIRRGVLYKIMKEESINKLALGHHKDDIVETFLMNIIYQGNRNIMKPAYISEENKVMVIRPLAFVEEKNIINYAKKLGLPVLNSKCPYETSKDSRRLKIKNLIKELSLENKDIRSVIMNSIKDLFWVLNKNILLSKF